MYFKKSLNASKAFEHSLDRGIVEIPVGYYWYVPVFPKYISPLINTTLEHYIITPTNTQYSTVCVCVCVFSSHLFWTSSSLDVPAGVTQDFSSTFFLRCVP